MNVDIDVEETNEGPDAGRVRGELARFNAERAEPENHRPLAVYAHAAEGGMLGGLLGGTYWGWLYVDRLWVAGESRGRGIGSALLAAAEEEALRRGCRRAHLDTHDFQALDFYLDRGYREAGRLEDLPPGHVKVLLRKDLG